MTFQTQLKLCPTCGREFRMRYSKKGWITPKHRCATGALVAGGIDYPTKADTAGPAHPTGAVKVTLSPPITKEKQPLETFDIGEPSVFLAGSIGLGKAEQWQRDVIDRLNGFPVTFLNPRRDRWNWKQPQRAGNKEFRQQVEWELAGLEVASLVTMYFDPEMPSPITLLELGLYARSGKLVVCCPDGFRRKGNVELVCRMYDVPLVETFTDFISLIAQRLKDLGVVPGE